MLNTRLLILAYSFPPDTEVGGQRPARFCRYLPEYGIEPIVLSIREQYYAGRDNSFAFPEALRIERTAVIKNPLRLYGAMKTGLGVRNGVAGQPSVGSFIPEPNLVSQEKTIGFRDHAIACFLIPDGYWGWYWPALRRAREIIRSERISAILSTSPPVTAHLIAHSLKRQFGIPWIADFRDPWRDSRSAEQSPSWYLRVSEKFKRRCVESTDRVLCNTDRLRLQMNSEFPALPESHFVTLTNGFDDDMGGAATGTAQSKVVSVLHIGTLYGDRRIDGLARAVKRLRDESTLKYEVKFVFLGAEEAAAREQVMQVAPELLKNGMIEFRPRVPRSELKGTLAGANVLLLVQGDYELQVPAKFYEYLPTGLPMLAVTKPGALSDIVNATGSGICADPSDVESLASSILRVIDMPRKSPVEVARNLGGYHYRELTARLADIVREVSGAHAEGQPECGKPLPEDACARATSEVEKT